MTLDEFNRIFSQMNENFGQKAYPPARVALIWNNVKRLEAGEFDAIVRNLVISESHPPAPGKIISACLEAMNRQRIKNKQADLDTLTRTGTQCRWCGNSGRVQAYPRDPRVPAGHPFAFRCLCQAGQIDGSAIPIWHTDMLKDWRVEEYPTKTTPALGHAKVDPMEIIDNLTRGFRSLGPRREEA